jgi:acetyl esterase/lipase
MREILDIPYGTDSQQKWDLYMPPHSDVGSPAGVIVFVHGGAWRRYVATSSNFMLLTTPTNSGDKSEHQGLAKGLVDAIDLPVAVPNYRLSPRVAPEISVDLSLKHPMHVQDIALALSEIRRSDHLSGASLNHIYLVGHSCGAHMISSLLLRPPPGEDTSGHDPVAQDVYDSVKGVALAEGIYDLDLLLKTFPGYRDFIQGAFDNTTASFSRFASTDIRRGMVLLLNGSSYTHLAIPWWTYPKQTRCSIISGRSI